MKNLLFILLLALVSSCSNNDDTTSPNPIDQLPPATQTGENTFGFLVNGKPVSITNSSEMVAIYQGGILQLGAHHQEVGIDESIIIWLDENLEIGTYFLNQNVSNIAFYKNLISGCNDFETYSPNSGRIQIDFIDQIQFIISGTFEFEAYSEDCQENISITHGRFDMRYIP